MSNDVVVIILATIVLVNAVESFFTNRTLFRHQKALEWFANHVHLNHKAVPGDAPKELWDLISGKEQKNNGE